jgi:hypothetical protein
VSTTNNYHRLNLSKSPLLNHELALCIDNEYNFFEDTVNFLTPELLDQFNSIGLVPTLAVIFSLNYSSRSDQEAKKFIHKDLTWYNDKWNTVPFAVNWELNSDIHSDIFWYDVSECEQQLPPAYPTYPWNHLSGIFYQGPATVIEHVEVDSKYTRSPILFNTSTPHAVGFSTSASHRCGLSVRFSIDQISTWNDAVYRFQEFICKD